MFSVYQHWDPLKVCVVGRSYPPEFYSWIKVSHVRQLFEKIALETEEDYQAIISVLEKFGVQILRPTIPKDILLDSENRFARPPMVPRDTMVMIGQDFYAYQGFSWYSFYHRIKDPSWSEFDTLEQFLAQAPQWQIDEVRSRHGLPETYPQDLRYKEIFDYIQAQGNRLIESPAPETINGAMVSRIGKDLYFATESYMQDQDALLRYVNSRFTHTRNHVVNTGGHGDGTYCPVCPGLIISLRDVPTYKTTFPGWEVVYLPNQSWNRIQPFLYLKRKNHGRWWIPGFEYDQSVIDVVENWMSHWTGYVQETVFDVNMLIIDPKNVLVFNHNDLVFKALDRYGITAHVTPFRHRYFWDGGIHCVTTDLDREGTMQDFFPNRG